jgi:hypothetical protein
VSHDHNLPSFGPVGPIPAFWASTASWSPSGPRPSAQPRSSSWEITRQLLNDGDCHSGDLLYALPRFRATTVETRPGAEKFTVVAAMFISESSGTTRKGWFVRHHTSTVIAQLTALTLLLLTVREMYREYVSSRGRIDRHIHRRDVRHGGFISKIHAVVSVSKKGVRRRQWVPKRRGVQCKIQG